MKYMILTLCMVTQLIGAPSNSLPVALAELESNLRALEKAVKLIPVAPSLVEDPLFVQIQRERKPGKLGLNNIKRVLKHFGLFAYFAREQGYNRLAGFTTEEATIPFFEAISATVPFDKKKLDDADYMKNYITEATEFYKIHLMPQLEDVSSILFLIFQEAQRNPQFGRCVADLKFMPDYTPVSKPQGSYMPLIVIYAGKGKACAQQLLDMLYGLLKGYPGAHFKPRFSAKVTDLIWFAQGDGDHKRAVTDTSIYYEGPDFVYFKPNVLPGNPKNYYLISPQ